ncbi:MAG: hypothetical protein LBL98_08690 [Ruminococcus sp.]|jgi:hypothetical protein|nr:hypothetical protein [Ruminococcus sp.]
MTVDNNSKKRVKKLKYRFMFIMLFALLSFLTAFTLYMKDDEDLVLPFGLFAKEDTGGVSDKLPDSPVLITAKNNAAVNPVPEKKAKDKTLGSDTLFVGSDKLSGLYEYDLAANKSVIADVSINSSNLGNLVVRRDNENKTIKNIVMEEKLSRVFILLDPETELDTVSLEDFCADLMSNNKSLKIYLISSLPQTGADKFNEELLKFADENGVYYLDFSTVIVGNDGNITSTYAEDGGLNKDGFLLLQDYIATHYA